jgi:hypothetical protein
MKFTILGLAAIAATVATQDCYDFDSQNI